MRTAFEREGDIRSVDLPGALATLWQERATGALSFSRGEERVRFEILEGELVGAYSSDPSFDTAQVLIRAGKLDGAALEGRKFSRGRDRARAARDLGVLTERDWRWGEKIRAVEILSDLIGWLEGRYSFDTGERPEPGEFRLGIERLLLELFLRSRDREFVHRSLGAVDAPLQRAEDFEERFPGLGLTTDAEAVVTAIDGRATAAEISRRVGPDPFSVEKLLAALTTLGLIHPEYAAPPRPKRPAPTKAGPPAPTVPAVALESPLPAAETPASAPETPASAPQAPASEVLREPERAAPPPPGPLVESPRELEPVAEALEEPIPVTEPVELPLAAAPALSEAEPMVTSWEPIPPEPLDQAFALPEPPSPVRTTGPGLSALWLLLVLAVAVGALLVFRSRHGGPAAPVSGAAISPTPVPTKSTTPVATLPPAPAGAASPVATRPMAAPPTRALPIPPTHAPTAIPPHTIAVAPAAPARPPAPDRRHWMERAQSDLREARGDRQAHYAIQVELVCELASLDEAWRYDRNGALWLLTADYRGQRCFRVFWGRYATLEEARAAKSSVPRFFFTPTNQPTVVSTRALLP